MRVKWPWVLQHLEMLKRLNLNSYLFLEKPPAFAGGFLFTVQIFTVYIFTVYIFTAHIFYQYSYRYKYRCSHNSLACVLCAITFIEFTAPVINQDIVTND